MNDLRRTTAAQLEAMGFSHRDARTLILSDNLPTPLTADILKNFELLFRYIDPSKLKPEEVMMAAYFVRRPVEQVRFMAEIPDKYDFSPEETEKYFENILSWDLSCDLRDALDGELSELLPDAGARERMYRCMYISGAWWQADYLKDVVKALRRITVDAEAMSTYVNECYPMIFSFYSDAVACIDRLEEIFAKEHIQEILQSEPLLPREFTPHYDPEHDPEAAIRALTVRFSGYLK